MCQFLSAAVTAKGDVFTSDVSDSHEDIIEANNLDGDKVVRVEYTSETLTDVSTYKLKIDQDEIPDWWTDAIRDRVERKLHNMVKRMVLTSGEYKMLLGGKWVLGDNVQVKVLKSAYVIYVGGSAVIESVRGSAVIKYVGGSAVIESVRGSAVIKSVGGSAVIKYVGGSAVIESVGGSAVIEYVRGSAVIKYVGGSAVIESVEGSAVIKSVGGSAVIEYVRGSAVIEYVRGSARIITDNRIK